MVVTRLLQKKEEKKTELNIILINELINPFKHWSTLRRGTLIRHILITSLRITEVDDYIYIFFLELALKPQFTE